MLTEYHAHEMVTACECCPWNALKIGTAGEVDPKEGEAHAEGFLVAPPNSSEGLSPQVELNRTVREALVQQHLRQFPRTKLIFDVRIDDPFLD